MAKLSKESDRRAVVEQMRREQQRQERRKSMLVIGIAVLIGAIIVGIAGWQLLKANQKSSGPLTSIGVPAGQAGCQKLVTKTAEGSAQHRPTGEKILYPDAPPAFGPHWGNYLTPGEVRRFFTADDRPPLERLVHSLEHGWSILWYDQTVADDPQAVDDLKAIGKKFPDITDPAQKLIIAPWTAADENGATFPGGAHVALSHWSMGGTNGNPTGQIGVWRYCRQVSGEVVSTFMKDYPAQDSPEGNVPGIF